jgi:hypothetical protein
MSIKVTRAVAVEDYDDVVVESDERPHMIRFMCEGPLLLSAAEARDIADSLYLAADEADINSEGE